MIEIGQLPSDRFFSRKPPVGSQANRADLLIAKGKPCGLSDVYSLSRQALKRAITTKSGSRVSSVSIDVARHSNELS